VTQVPVATIAPGDHIVADEQLEDSYIAALHTAAKGGYVLLERWQELIRDPATKGLEFVWRWHLQVIGSVHGYEPRELLLDLAVPLRAGTGDSSNPEVLAARGTAATLLGIGKPNAEPVEEEENKIIDMPVAAPAPPPTTPLPNWDPNLFPG
jgi:hypothetical protein